MADINSIRDIADIVRGPYPASAFGTLTAGGSGNNTQITGTTIDRMDPATGSMSHSAAITYFCTAVLSANKTLSLNSVLVQTSPDGSTWSTLVTPTSPGVLLSSTGGGTVSGTARFNVNLDAAYRYFRVNGTPVLSNTSTDTATVIAAVVQAGFDRLAA